MPNQPEMKFTYLVMDQIRITEYTYLLIENRARQSPNIGLFSVTRYLMDDPLIREQIQRNNQEVILYSIPPILFEIAARIVAIFCPHRRDSLLPSPSHSLGWIDLERGYVHHEHEWFSFSETNPPNEDVFRLENPRYRPEVLHGHFTTLADIE